MKSAKMGSYKALEKGAKGKKAKKSTKKMVMAKKMDKKK
jgi:hypothetical protein